MDEELFEKFKDAAKEALYSDEELFRKLKEMADDVAIIYPKERTQEQAEELSRRILDSIGVAKFKNKDDGQEYWGVLLRRSALEEGDKIGNDSM